jgi:hypothetical protein
VKEALVCRIYQTVFTLHPPSSLLRKWITTLADFINSLLDPPQAPANQKRVTVSVLGVIADWAEGLRSSIFVSVTESLSPA